LSHASLAGATYERDTSCALARAQPVMWCHVGANRVVSSGMNELRRLLWRDWRPSRLASCVHKSHQSRQCDLVVLDRLDRLAVT
jgi:hypothetical protein